MGRSLKNINFNSHAHVERDKAFLTCNNCFTDFNSHAHVERDRVSQNQNAACPYFNSHAHVERDEMSYISHTPTAISTHTLTWSVTRATFRHPYTRLIISTHTLTWSVTAIVKGNVENISDFNSHAHVERDA